MEELIKTSLFSLL